MENSATKEKQSALRFNNSVAGFKLSRKLDMILGHLRASSSAIPRRLRAALQREGSRKLLNPPRQASLTDRHWGWFPKQLVVLDIEGSGKTPNKSELYIAGVLPYTRKNHCYLPGRYRAFEADELSILAEFLSSFDGPLLGQNLFDYDYRVLARHINVDSLISRTIDIRAVLEHVDLNSVKHLSLQHLAIRNINKGKLGKSAHIPALWRAGKRAFVRRYNRRDLELTAELWFRLATSRIVLLQDRFQMGPRELLAWHRIPFAAWRLLIGRAATLNAERWHENISQYGHGLGARPKRPEKFFIETAAENEEKLFIRLDCSSCRKQSVLVISQRRVLKENEVLPCPFCSKVIALDHISLVANLGEGLGFLRINAANTNLGVGYILPTETVARRWIRGLRFWRY